MFLIKLRLALFVTLTVAGVSAGALAYQTRDKQPAEKQPAPKAKAAEKQPRTDLYGDPLPPGALARLGTIRLRHSFAAMAFSAEGKTLISAGEDQTVRYWDAGTGKEGRRTLLQSRKKLPNRSLVLAADGKSVVGFTGAAVCVWDASTGKERNRIPMNKVGFAPLALSPDGKTVAADIYEAGDFIRLWDVATGKELHRLAHEQSTPALAFSPDGKLLGATGASDVLHLWEVATGKEIRKMRVGGDCLTFSPHGKWVVQGDFEGNVKRWDVASGKKRPAPRRMPTGITSLTISPDGKLLAVGTRDEELILWDVAARKQLWKMPAQCRGLLFAPDGKTVASSSAAAIHLWDVATGKEIGSRPAHDGDVDSLAVSPDGKILATASLFDKAIRLWDPSSGELLTRLPGHGGGSHTCAFSADGKLVVSGGGDRTVRVWDRASGKEVRSFPVESLPQGTIKLRTDRVNLSQQGDHLAAISNALTSSIEAQLDVWEMSTGKRLAHRPCPFGWAESAVCVAPDGRRIAVFNDRGAVVEDAVTGQALVRISGNLGPPLAFSPDGQLLAAAVYKSQDLPPDQRIAFIGNPKNIVAIRLTEVATGKPLISLKTGGSDFPLLAFSPRGRVLATNDAETIHLWDVATGEELLRRSPPERLKSLPARSSLAFLPGGRLATGLADGTVLIWDVASAVRRAGMPAKGLDGAELQRLWADLAGEDAAKAHQAVWKLAAVPAKAVPFLRDHLRPAVALDAKRLQRLIDDLDSPEFAEREEARKKLASFAEQVEPALRQALKGKPSLEMRKRLEALHADAEFASHGVVRSPQLLRTLRAIRVLEHIGDQGARQVLQKLAAGDSAARSTRQVKEALQRLERRAARQGSR